MELWIFGVQLLGKTWTVAEARSKAEGAILDRITTALLSMRRAVRSKGVSISEKRSTRTLKSRAKSVSPLLVSPAIFPVAYSVETFVPFLKLRISQYWTPNSGSWLQTYLWLHIAAGWILTTLWVGG